MYIKLYIKKPRKKQFFLALDFKITNQSVYF